MDGLDEFEKSLAAEKAEREREEEKKHRKHRHHHHRRDRSAERDRDGHRHKSHRSHDRDDRNDEDGHRHKRSRREHKEHRRGENDHGRDSAKHSHVKASDVKEDLPLPNEEITAEDSEKPASTKPLVRDSWMTDPSAIDIDYVQRGAKQSKASPPPKQQPKRDIHAREINAAPLQALNDGKSLDELDVPAQHEVDYKFGDGGSQWRMTKLNGVYRTAEETSRPVEAVAVERYGGLREFDDAREEKIELDRRRVYGEGYVGKEKPSGEIFQERKLDMGIHETRDGSTRPAETELEQGVVIPDDPSSHTTTTTRIDQTTLNHLRARMMKAKLKKAPDAAKLEAEFNQAAAAYKAQGPPEAVVLNVMENRMLAGTRAEAKAVDTKRGRERGLVEENDEMSIEDMVREERRTRGQGAGGGSDGLRLAERIAKDGKFDNDLEYMDDNAEKLARRVQKSELSLKNAAVGEFQRTNRILDTCPLCFHDEDNNSASEQQQQPAAPVVSLGTRVYLTLPTEPELAEGGAVLVPLQHRTNLLECDDDEWEELRNFMKCLTRMYHAQGREVVFYENAAAPRRRHPHAAMQAVPIPWDLGATAPAFFREAMLAADEEWAQHRKVVDTRGKGRMAFRRAIAKEAPYFHAWFDLDGGLGHVVEDERRWPRGDLFAREVLGGMLDVMPDVVKRQGRWRRGDEKAKARVEAFRKRWRMFDWTRVLTEGQGEGQGQGQ
ncbi:Pre-mRNA-splicing factor cwf19 [Diatrype stigma]|uniref:Pre-mRNA-splicing factor cwf19 n=1 Tax=Diatrype stigma TaxID=117547 RepID=A0AAN9U7B3_9PEZI